MTIRALTYLPLMEFSVAVRSSFYRT